MTMSVRMDAETERLLENLARERGSTKSEIVREAVRLAARRRPRSRTARPLQDAFRGVIGSVRGGRCLGVGPGNPGRGVVAESVVDHIGEGESLDALAQVGIEDAAQRLRQYPKSRGVSVLTHRTSSDAHATSSVAA